MQKIQNFSIFQTNKIDNKNSSLSHLNHLSTLELTPRTIKMYFDINTEFVGMDNFIRYKDNTGTYCTLIFVKPKAISDHMFLYTYRKNTLKKQDLYHYPNYPDS